MMRFLLGLCAAGAVVYAFLPPSSGPDRDWNVESAGAETHPTPQSDRKLRSWGPTLSSLAREREARPAGSQPFDRPLPPRQIEASQRAPGTGDSLARAIKAPATVIDAGAEPVLWAKVTLAARAHSDASVSSPVTKFYRPGTELQVVARENGWLALLDPVTLERGWVFEKYLVAIDGPSRTESALGSAPRPKTAKVASKVEPQSKSSKPMMQASNDKPAIEASGDIEAAQTERRRERLAKKDERRERKLFRLFGGRYAGSAPWTVGSPR